jgi:hypothetical protein
MALGRFQKLDSCVSVVEPAKERTCNDTAEPFDRTRVQCVLPEGNVSSRVIIMGLQGIEWVILGDHSGASPIKLESGKKGHKR